MASTLIITGSPSNSSRTLRFAHTLGDRLGKHGLDSSLLDLRSLPAEDLLLARVEAPAIRAALEQLAAARGVVVVTPVYKAAYSGILKTFLDLLPQFGLREKVVLPLAMGGSLAHVLTIDYALRPVLSSLDPLHIVTGLFLLAMRGEAARARAGALAFGVFYAVVAVWGFITGDSVFGIVAIDDAANWVHAGLAALAILSALASPSASYEDPDATRTRLTIYDPA